MAFVPLGYPGVLNINEFHLNMYTSPACFSIVLYIFLVLLIIKMFNEYVVLDLQGNEVTGLNENELDSLNGEHACLN